MKLIDYIKANGIEGFSKSYLNSETGNRINSVNLDTLIEDAVVTYAYIDFEENTADISIRIERKFIIRVTANGKQRYFSVLDLVEDKSFAYLLTRREAKERVKQYSNEWLDKYDADSIEIVRVDAGIVTAA